MMTTVTQKAKKYKKKQKTEQKIHISLISYEVVITTTWSHSTVLHKAPSIATQLNSTRRGVELSCVAINGP